MHHCLNVNEIVRLVAYELTTLECKTGAIAMACCCKSFEDPVLDAIWETQRGLVPLLRTFPEDVWEEDYAVSPRTTCIIPPSPISFGRISKGRQRCQN